MIVIEDAHWLDSASWALVQRAAESIESLLLVLATRPLSEPPPELQDLLASSRAVRIRLGPLAPGDILDLVKQRLGVSSFPPLTIKVASVIGRVVAYQVMTEIHPIPEDIPRLAESLDMLARLNLTPLESPEPNLSYIFKHVITQEVAYGLMLYAHRQRLHRANVSSRAQSSATRCRWTGIHVLGYHRKLP